MRRMAVAMILATTLLLAGCSGNESGQGSGKTRQGSGNTAHLLSGPVQTVAPPEGPCNATWPRQGNLTGPLAKFAVSCYTDAGTSMQFTNTSPFVLRVWPTSAYVTRWEVWRPFNADSWTTSALNYSLPADYDAYGAALLVPGASLVAAGSYPVTFNFKIVLSNSAVAFGSNVFANWIQGISNRARDRVYPGAALLQQTATCATEAHKLFGAYVSHNKEDVIIKVADVIPPCVSLIKQVLRLADGTQTPPSTIGDELVDIARAGRTSLLEQGVKLGGRVIAVATR